MTSTVACAAILLACSLALSAAQSSCKGRCGAEYNRAHMCQCDYNCLVYGECCPDYEYQCTTRTSCKGRCGESFKRGRLCSCDPDCMKFKQCCSDVTNHCDADEMSGAASAAQPGKANSCHNVNDNKPKEPVLKDATEATFSEGQGQEDLLPPVSTSEYPNGDQDSFSPFDDDFPSDGTMDLEPSSTVNPDPLEPQSSDDGSQDSGILSSTIPPTGAMPTEATGPEVPTTASNPPEATASTGPTQPPDINSDASGMPASSTLEPASILDDAPEPNAEDVTASPLSQDEQDNSVPEGTPSTDDAQTRGDDVPRNPLPQDSDDQATPTTVKPIVQEQDQSNDDAKLEATPSTDDAQTDGDDVAPTPLPQDVDEQTTPTTIKPTDPGLDDTKDDAKPEATPSTDDAQSDGDDAAPTPLPQDVDDQANASTQPIDQGQDDTKDDAKPEATPSTDDAQTDGDDAAPTPLPQDVDGQATPTTIKPTDPGLDDTKDDALPEATPSTDTGSKDVTKSPTAQAQDGTTADNTLEVTTADPLNVTPEPTKAPLKPQDKPVPSNVLPAKPDQDAPGTKPGVRPLNPAGNVDDTTGYQGDGSNDTNLCSGQPVSAVTTLRNGTVAVFRGHFFWFLDRNMVPGPARSITQVWGVPSPIDTVFTRCNCQGKTYLFKGPQYWRFENDVLDSGYPKPIATGFDGLRGHITAALSVPQYQSRGESVYFFKRGGLVQKYSYQFGTTPTCGRKPQYSIYTVRNRVARQAVSNLGPTISIRRSWRGFPTTVTAAVSIPTRRQPEGYKYYVFSRSKAYNVRMDRESPVVAAAPAAAAANAATQNNFFKCPKKV
ncbi:proteoglycan 4b isoform X2 [Nelusetta ayraudi]|uniref:proteoglycan 4b isoform X2 n=1 Tax=Nelusetta ayraudi TaxID=303726 RepID=UPI003F70530C